MEPAPDPADDRIRIVPLPPSSCALHVDPVYYPLLFIANRFAMKNRLMDGFPGSIPVPAG
jgi:hypothetical protein